MNRSVAAAALAVAMTGSAQSATADEERVHVSIGEGRACAPYDGGFVVGTGGGLVAYDAIGTVRAVWTAADGLPGTRVDAVVDLGDGTGGSDLWIGTDGGAARVRISGTRLELLEVAVTKPVRDLARWQGATYAATWDGGVVKLGRGSKPKAIGFRGRKSAARARVSSLAIVDGVLWAGTDAGLYRLERGRLSPVVFAAPAQAPHAVVSLLAEPRGDAAGDRLWIATADGLLSHDRDGTRSYGGSELRRLAIVDGNVAAAALGAGVQYVDRDWLVPATDRPAEVTMPQAMAERAGAACVVGVDGTWFRAGAGMPWVAAATHPGPPSPDISALAADGERLWVGTFDRGLAVYEGDRWRVVVGADLDRRINAIVVEARAGSLPVRVWVGTAAGLMVVDGDRVTRVTRRDGLPGRSVLSLARLRDGRVVAGTSTGAVVFAPSAERSAGVGFPARIGPPGSDVGNVWAVAQDATGALWLGTTTGLYRGPAEAVVKGELDPRWQRFARAAGYLDDDWVTALATHGDEVWAGTYNGGIVRFEIDDAARDGVRATRASPGWINPGGLTWDGDILHAATMDGLRTRDVDGTWRAIVGLPGRDVTAVVRTTGALWIATRRGLMESRFDLD